MEIRPNPLKTESKPLKDKHLTIIGLNYYPEDSAIGLYTTQLSNFLKEQGAIVSVISAFPYYPQWKIADNYINKKRFHVEEIEGIKVYRFKQYTPANPTFVKRVWHIIDFTIGSFRNIRKIKECDYVISIVPFTSSAFLGNLLKRRTKAKHWIHIQDFEFDAAFQSGLVNKKKGIIYSLLMRLEKGIYSRADCVSTISHLMMAKLQGKTTSKTYYLPNWTDAEEINPATCAQHPYLSSPKFKIVYSGNIGDKQDWAFFSRFINLLNFEKFELIIVGDGSKRKQLEEEIKNYPGITMYAPIAYEDLSSLLCSADAHFLFQKFEVVDTVMPSKILGMMASAKPSVITGHPESEVAKVMEESQGGYFVSIDNVAPVIQHFENLATQRDKARRMGENARTYVIRNFSRDQILRRFVSALEQV